MDKTCSFMRLIIPSCLIGISHSDTSMTNMLGFYIADRTGDEREVSAFGTSVFLNMMTLYMFSQPIIERTSIACSLDFGAKKYDRMKSNFIKGAAVVLLLAVLVYLPVVCFSDRILISAGIDQVVGVKTRNILLKLFLFDLIRMLSELLIAYMTSQGHETGYGLITCITMSLTLPTGYYLGIKQGLGVDGLIVARIILEISKFSILAFTYCIKIPNNGFNFRHLKLATEGLVTFFKELFQFTVGICSEYIGFQISGFMVLLLKDPFQIAAFTSMSNIVYLLANIGYGFSLTIRARCNFLIGRKDFSESKEFFKLSTIGFVSFICIFSILLFFNRKILVDLYSSNNPEVGKYLELLMIALCCTIHASALQFTIFSISRSTNQGNLIITLDIIIILFLQSAAGIVSLNLFNPNCITFLYIKNFSMMLIEAIMFWRMMTMDWKTEINAHVEEQILLPECREDSGPNSNH